MIMDEKHEDNDSTSEHKEVDVHFNYRLTKQIYLVVVYVCMGLSGTLYGPTLPDLTQRIGIDYEEISRALAVKSIGGILGCIAGGFLHHLLVRYTDLINAASLLMMAAGSFMMPWSNSIPMAAAAFFLGGISEGLLNTGGDSMTMRLWGEKAASPLHSLHFGFGFGALLSPQIARAFLSPDQANNGTDATTVSPEMVEDLSRIEIPYSIVGTILVIVAIVSVIFYIKGSPEGFPLLNSDMKLKEMLSPGSCSGGYPKYSIILFTAILFFFINAIGGEVSYVSFLFSYGYESGLMNKDQASNLQSLFWLSFTTARVFGILVTSVVALHIVFTINLVFFLTLATILAIFAYDSVIVLTVFSTLVAIPIALNFPNGMGWSNLHLTMNSIGVMMIVLGSNFGQFVYNYMAGYLFEDLGPQTLMYVLFTASLLSCVSYLLMTVIARHMNPLQKSHMLFSEPEGKVLEKGIELDKFEQF